MVSSVNMLLITSTPSAGHPVILDPLVGMQLGDPYGRVPTRIMPLGPTVEPAERHCGVFPGGPEYGSSSPLQPLGATLKGCTGWVTEGITVPGAT